MNLNINEFEKKNPLSSTKIGVHSISHYTVSALIGFIILVFAVFTASVGDQLGQVQFANSVFIAAIVGAFTLVGVIVYQIRGGNGK